MPAPRAPRLLLQSSTVDYRGHRGVSGAESWRQERTRRRNTGESGIALRHIGSGFGARIGCADSQGARSLRGRNESAATGGGASRFAPPSRCDPRGTRPRIRGKSGSRPTRFASTRSTAQTLHDSYRRTATLTEANRGRRRPAAAEPIRSVAACAMAASAPVFSLRASPIAVSPAMSVDRWLRQAPR